MVHTSDVPGAGTGGGVWVDLEGLVASRGPQDLPSAPLAFERGQVSNNNLWQLSACLQCSTVLHAFYKGCCVAMCQNVQIDPCMQLTAWSLPACCLFTETLCTSSLNDKRCLPAVPCCAHKQAHPRSLTELVPYFPYHPPCRAWSAWHLVCPQAICCCRQRPSLCTRLII